MLITSLGIVVGGFFLFEADAAPSSLAEWRDVMSRIDLADPASKRFVPDLIALMDDADVPWTTRRQAALTLGRLGPLARDAVPRVASHLDDVSPDDPETSPQRWALSALALFGREAHAVAPKLVRMLADPSQPLVTRLGCLEALSQIGPAAPQAIPALWKELERHVSGAAPDDEFELAIGAAEALGMVGPDAAPAVPVLIRAGQSDSEHLRREALRALGRIGPSARDAQPLLCDALLADESAIVRDVATVSLGQTGPTAWPLVQPLLAAEEVDVRERAVAVVGGWKTFADAVLPAIEPLLSDSAPAVRLAAARSWRSLSGRSERIWPLLVDLLNDPDRDVRRGASRELQAIVQAEPMSESRLKPMFDDPRPEVRREAARLRRLLQQRISD